MRYWVPVASWLFFACVDGVDLPLPDPVEDPPTLNLYVPIGGECASVTTHGVACGVNTNGVCADDVCMPACSPVAYPRCAPGASEHFVDIDANTRACFCD
jgi:hypothetical protein